jgi:catechol 2,3-dioxygenase-like lactoylglutathione lyase family enzyme
MSFELAVPVLQVVDVAASIAWYREALGFEADPFPARPPYSFAILRRDKVEIMLQLAAKSPAGAPAMPGPLRGWSVYVRLEGGVLLDLAEALKKRATLLRGPERMPYGQVEMEVADPDGYRLCIAEVLDAGAAVPSSRE